MRGRLPISLLAAAFSALSACADAASPELLTLMDGFSAHRRVAIGYLRTNNAELGTIEIEHLRDRWNEDRRKLLPADDGDANLSKALTETEALLRASLAAADKSEIDQARGLLESAAQPLAAWRQSNGIRLFSDCITEMELAYARLDAHRLNAPKLDDATTAADVISAATQTQAELMRCDGEAPSGIRNEPEFRRLVDGMLGSLRQVTDAVRQHDAAYLHRLLIEQRSFERLLAFRFG